MAQEVTVLTTLAPVRAAPTGRVVEWLTIERAAYALAVIVALGVRLYGIGATSLTSAEALQALRAVDAMRGALPDLGGASPLLHVLQRVTFILFGATDAAARFWPALLAGFSPLLFYFLRRQLTPGGALAAAFIWSVSPLGVWSSRFAVGDGLTPTLALALLALLAAEQRGRRWAVAVGLVAGLLLATGPNAYTVILCGVAATVIFGDGLRGRRPAAGPRLAYAGLGLLGAVLFASFFLAEPAGLAALGELSGRWLSELLPGTGEYRALEMFARLLLTEGFVVVFGIAGIVVAFRQRDRFCMALAVATGLALPVALIGRGRHPSDLALVALGLTLLTGPVVSRVLANGYEWRRERDPWLLALVSLALLIAASFALPSGLAGENAGDYRTLYLGVGVATVVMALIVWIAYGVWDSWAVIARVVPLVFLVFGLAWHVSQMVSLSFDRGANRQAGILRELPAPDLPDLRRALLDLGGLTGGGQDASVDVAWPALSRDTIAPLLRWQLRDREEARFAASVQPDAAPLVITPLGAQSQLDGYSGTEFAISQRWAPGGFSDVASALRWIFYRETRAAPEPTRAILWVKWPQPTTR